MIRPIFCTVLFALLCSVSADAKPLKVYILCGQSNMEGHARITTFEAMKQDPVTAPILKEMVDADGKPIVCDDVYFVLDLHVSIYIRCGMS